MGPTEGMGLGACVEDEGWESLGAQSSDSR
jgi:hypothetical protein